MSLSHIICGVVGFLLGSAGVAEGSRKRNPVVFSLGLCCLLAGAAACFMAWLNRAIDEAEEDEDEDTEVIAADAAEKAKAVAEQAAEVAEKAAEAAEKAEAVAEKVAEAAAAIEEAAEEAADAAENAEDAE